MNQRRRVVEVQSGEPESHDEAVERRNALIKEVQDIQQQLGNIERALQLDDEAKSLGFNSNDLFSYSTRVALYSGNWDQAKRLMEESPVITDPSVMEKRDLFLRAMEDESGRHLFEQYLGNHCPQPVGQGRPDLSLFSGRKNLNNPVNGFGRTGSMKGTKYKVTG